MYSRVSVQDTKISGNLHHQQQRRGLRGRYRLRRASHDRADASRRARPSTTTSSTSTAAADGGAHRDGYDAGEDLQQHVPQQQRLVSRGGDLLRYHRQSGRRRGVRQQPRHDEPGDGTGIAGGIYVATGANPVRALQRHLGEHADERGRLEDRRRATSGSTETISVDPLYVNRNGGSAGLSPVAGEPGDRCRRQLGRDGSRLRRRRAADSWTGTTTARATVDMGAFEFQPDFDGDGTPDYLDTGR